MFGRGRNRPKPRPIFKNDKSSCPFQWSIQTILLMISVLINFLLIYSNIQNCHDARDYIQQRPEQYTFYDTDQISDPRNPRQLYNPANIDKNRISLQTPSPIKSPPKQERIIKPSINNKQLSLFVSTVLPGNLNENSNPNPPLPKDDYFELSKRHHQSHTITETEMNLWFHNKLFVFEDKKTAFCAMEKNSCTMFKQIFKRIRGKSDYLVTDYTRIHWLPYRGLEDISFYDLNNILRVMNDETFYFSAFVRDPLERLISGYIDKCEKKRGVNLCDYVRWSPIFKAKYGKDKHYNDVGRSWTPDFYMWGDGLINCPCWPETDKHFAPQSNFCNLFQYVDRYDIFRFENRSHRGDWMKRAGFWDEFGKQGWGSGGNDGISVVDYGPQSHSSTNKNRDTSKYVNYYKQNSTVTGLLINKYRIDYITFGLQMADWICNPEIKKTDFLKKAIRSLPRNSRPPCHDLKWLWIPE